MSIFAIITDLQITNPPSWYADFTEKYLSRPKPHITLIKPRYVEAEEGKQLLKMLREDFKEYSTMFPIIDKAQGIIPFDEGTGFIISINNEQVIEFQRKLRAAIPEQLEFVNPEGKIYEKDFRPHLTMADMIQAGMLPEIMEMYNMENLVLDVEVNCILCTLPPDFSQEESSKESNYYVMLP